MSRDIEATVDVLIHSWRGGFERGRLLAFAGSHQLGTIRGITTTDRYGRSMARMCARPACNLPADASFNFDGLARVVWLGPLDDADMRSAGDLCRAHADRLRPPLRWELRDVREDSPTRIGLAKGVTADEAKTPMLARAFRAAKAG